MVSGVHDFLAKRGIPLASNQINFSLMFRKVSNMPQIAPDRAGPLWIAAQVTHSLTALFRKDSTATAERCAELGVPLIAYFPLANGLLTGRYDANNLPAFPKSLTMKKYVVGGADGYPEGGYQPLLSELRRIAAARGKTVAQVSINWCLAKGAIPIPGARDGQMASDNLGAMGWRLDDSEVAALEAAADAIGFEFSSGGFKLE